jgi:biopolymer transport protein TolR
MSMDIGGSRGGLKADINVTPLVDVMLVLLIIMMLVAPMLHSGIPVTLPKASNSEPKPESPKQTVVGIAADGRLYLDSTPVSPDALALQVAERVGGASDRMVVIKADGDAKYAVVMATMDSLRAANIENVALITERRVPGGGGR